MKRADLRGRAAVGVKKRNREPQERRSRPGNTSMHTLLCPECGQPIKRGRHKPGEYEHAQGCSRDRKNRTRDKESRRWKPALWATETVGRKLRRVVRRAAGECEAFVGPHDGRIVAAGIHSQMKEVQSVAMLKRMGIKTIGEVEAQT